MSLLVYSIMIGISTFIVTFFVMYLDGPFDTFAAVREWATALADISRNGLHKHPSLNSLYSCFYCMSTWVCVVISILYYAMMPDIWLTQSVLVFICGLGVSSILNMLLVER